MDCSPILENNVFWPKTVRRRISRNDSGPNASGDPSAHQHRYNTQDDDTQDRDSNPNFRTKICGACIGFPEKKISKTERFSHVSVHFSSIAPPISIYTARGLCFMFLRLWGAGRGRNIFRFSLPFHCHPIPGLANRRPSLGLIEGFITSAKDRTSEL